MRNSVANLTDNKVSQHQDCYRAAIKSLKPRSINVAAERPEPILFQRRYAIERIAKFSQIEIPTTIWRWT
jgi:hypothetical protein